MMRTFEERRDLIHKRTAELRKKEQRRNRIVVDVLSTAACLLLIIGVAVYMPVPIQSFLEVDMSQSPEAASMIGGYVWAGYIVIGILAFFTGVSLTIFLYRLHRRNEPGNQEK